MLCAGTCQAVWLAVPLCPVLAQTASVGFERVRVPQPDGSALDGAFWFPSTSPVSAMRVGLGQQSVARGGTILGRRLPLVVISHGALGAWSAHADTAVALARAGFVVAALTHAEFTAEGALKLAGRDVQLRALIDYALQGWRGHADVDASAVGAFGFSAGGFTVLVAVGAKPDTPKILPHCAVAPKEWSCVLASRHHLDVATRGPPAWHWIADPRIRAAVIAAPALGYLFDGPALASVALPVQLWQAGSDRTLVEPWSVDSVRRNLPRAPDFHFVAGADHSDFGAPCAASVIPSAPQLCRDGSGFDREAFHTLFNAEIVAFFTKWLKPRQ